MGRTTPAWLLAILLIIVSAAPATSFAQDATDDAAAAGPRRAYKPAQRRAQEDEATQAARREAAPAKDDAAVPANITDPEAYKKELDAAKEQRDRDLKEAAKETDRRKFQKRQEEIFAQYASILAAMKDKYDASQADAAPVQQTPPRSGKGGKSVASRGGTSERYATPPRTDTRKRSTRSYDDDLQPDPRPPAPKGKKSKTTPRKGGGDNAGDGLAEAQKRLDDENSRHDSVMEQLNKDLSDAQASKKQREIRKAERAIDKENTTYEAKKALLESRVKELGGKVETPARPAAKSPVQ
jgi:hypothetical protein